MTIINIVVNSYKNYDSVFFSGCLAFSADTLALQLLMVVVTQEMKI